jgi:uncharacterized repeat protein (TIGR03803 family)
MKLHKMKSQQGNSLYSQMVRSKSFMTFDMTKGAAAAALQSRPATAAAAALQSRPATAAKHPRSPRMAAMAIVFALAFVLMPSTQAQTYKVLHNFTGGPQDGQSPHAGVTMDTAGNLYGTTYYGGSTTNGTAYKLTKNGSGFVYSGLIHSFGSETDGSNPDSKVTIGPDGALYGATNIGVPNTGCGNLGCGIIFKLTGTESVAYQFTGQRPDSGYPDSAPIFDPSGNMFGALPGDICCGIVYELTRSGSGWKENDIYPFKGTSDGSVPKGGVIRDQAGNLYGVTYAGGTHNGGVVYELSPVGSGWTEKVLYNFDPASAGINPMGGLLLDQAGNLYGTTTLGGPLGGGTVFMLSHGTWTLTVIHKFQRTARGPLPAASLSFDAAGNLYGTTLYGGSSDLGTVFKLTRGSWTYSVLKNFTNGADGGLPQSDVIFDASGHLYGTASKGGTSHLGVVWQITP